MLNIHNFTFNLFQEVCTVIWDDTMEGAIVDPGCLGEEECRRLSDHIEDNGIKVRMILLTHGHFDHIYGVPAMVEKFGVPVYMHPADKVLLENNHFLTGVFGMPDAPKDFATKDIKEDDRLSFGNTVFEVIETPGHTPGCVCFYDDADKLLISGDTLFAGSIGRTDSAWGDYDKEIVSIMDKIMGLDGEVAVIPGHGPKTDIAYERTHNPFLQPFNEPEEDMDWDGEGLSIDGDIQ
ncbi:MAG: MBL fold metallo-hydrolase [Bacteroidales bacterium]|nr:MBL fold metallo-hydrolase [Bacteroidales bacterium]